MESLKIDSGEVRLSVNGDESRVIKFNPSDVLFAEKFYKALGEMELKADEYQKRIEGLEANKEEKDGLPVNMPERLELLHETCDYIKSLIDGVFGAGTSLTAFGEAANLDMFSQFFDGVAPYFQKTRTEKVSQYIPNVRKPAGKRRKKK